MEPVTEKCSSEAESDGIGRAEIRREMLMQMAPGAKAEREGQRKRSVKRIVKRCIGQISCTYLEKSFVLCVAAEVRSMLYVASDVKLIISVANPRALCTFTPTEK